ncbi:MAG: hypothetical protein KJZ54_01520 [Phycisphaerales bacterium]|nr:hypothetical protein [Phycisphaerales bacterium]
MNIPNVAKYQKWLILAIAAQLGAVAIRVWLTLAAGEEVNDAGSVAALGGALLMLMVQLGAGVFGLVMLILLMSALDRPIVSRVLAGISQFIPLVGLIVLLFVNQRATRVLRENGYHVGFLGASKRG